MVKRLQSLISQKYVNRRIYCPVQDGKTNSHITYGFLSGKNLRKRAHNIINQNFVLLYLIEGQGTYTNHRGKAFPLEPGILIQRLPRKAHHIIRDDAYSWLEFYLSVPESMAKQLHRMHLIDLTRTAMTIGLPSSLLEQLKTLVMKPDPTRDHERGQTVIDSQQLILDFYRQQQLHPHHSPHHQAIERACELLGQQLAQPLSIDAVAQSVGLGYENFRKLFREHMNTSPKQYRIQKKIEHAQRLLQTPHTTLQSIADKLGYPDVATFSKQFSKTTGSTPGRFRSVY